jgi:hypothetical protein
MTSETDTPSLAIGQPLDHFAVDRTTIRVCP